MIDLGAEMLSFRKFLMRPSLSRMRVETSSMEIASLHEPLRLRVRIGFEDTSLVMLSHAIRRTHKKTDASV